MIQNSALRASVEKETGHSAAAAAAADVFVCEKINNASKVNIFRIYILLENLAKFLCGFCSEKIFIVTHTILILRDLELPHSCKIIRIVFVLSATPLVKYTTALFVLLQKNIINAFV